MTPQESARAELKKLKGKPLAYKVNHILTYYYRAILGTAVIVFCLASLIYCFVTADSSSLNIVCVNASANTSLSQEDLYEALGIDPETQSIQLYTDIYITDQLTSDSYQSQSKLFALIVASEVDIILGDSQLLLEYAYSDYFTDVTSILPESYAQQFESNYLYIDSILLESSNVNSGEVALPAPDDPTTMVAPVPVLINLPSTAKLAEYCYPKNPENIAIGVMLNSKNEALAYSVLKHILDSCTP